MAGESLTEGYLRQMLESSMRSSPLLHESAPVDMSGTQEVDFEIVLEPVDSGQVTAANLVDGDMLNPELDALQPINGTTATITIPVYDDASVNVDINIHASKLCKNSGVSSQLEDSDVDEFALSGWALTGGFEYRMDDLANIQNPDF